MTSCGCGRKRKGVAYRIEHHFVTPSCPEHILGYVGFGCKSHPGIERLPPPVPRIGRYGTLVPYAARRWRTFEIVGRGRNCRKGQNETNCRKLDHCPPLPESGNGE